MYQQQVSDHFIGRRKELATFEDWLNDPQAPWILYFHDAAEEAERKGGVGKTWLLRRCGSLMEQKRHDVAIVFIDFFTISDRDRVFLAEKIVEGLQQLYPEWTPGAFLSTIQQYREEKEGTAFALENVDTRNTPLRELVAVALMEDMRQLEALAAQDPKTLLVFFDTFEAVEQDPLLLALRSGQLYPDTYQFPGMRVVMAGRNELNWDHPNWRGREEEVRSMALSPFNPEEMIAYLKSEMIVDDLPVRNQQVDALYERTEGRPILVGLVIDVLNNRILSLDELINIPKSDFEGYLVQQVNKLENPINWVILFMAHVYHRFNLSVLDWIVAYLDLREKVQEIGNEALTRTLPRLTFVRRASSGEDFVLHDEMRRLVNKYCWPLQDPDRRLRTAISRCIVEYYEQEIKRLDERSSNQAANEQMRQTCTIEILSHRLFADLADGLRYFGRQYQPAARQGKIAFARLLLQETQTFREHMSSAQRCDLLYAEMRIYRAEEKSEEMLRILKELKAQNDPQWLEEHQQELLLEEGWAYRYQGRLADYERCFQRCLEIEEQKPKETQSTVRRTNIMTHLGYISRRRGHFTQALAYFEQALVIYKELDYQVDYANTLTNMSIVYRLQGRTEEALRRCKIGLQIRRQIFLAGKSSELPVAFSLGNIGVIHVRAGNIIEAEQYFKEAYEIYQRTNDRVGIAHTYNRLGEVELLKGEYDRAWEWFEKARASSHDLEDEQYINSLNKLGQICALWKKNEDAASFFEQAIAHARQVFDNYQLVESLIFLSKSLALLQKAERAQRALQEAEQIASQENYANLLGNIEYERGNIAYKEKQYHKAFRHFVLFCQHMTNYNRTQYSLAVRKITDALFGMPKDLVSPILQELRAYWEEQGLGRDYPELLEACEEMDDLAFPG